MNETEKLRKENEDLKKQVEALKNRGEIQKQGMIKKIKRRSRFP